MSMINFSSQEQECRNLRDTIKMKEEKINRLSRKAFTEIGSPNGNLYLAQTYIHLMKKTIQEIQILENRRDDRITQLLQKKNVKPNL